MPSNATLTPLAPVFHERQIGLAGKIVLNVGDQTIDIIRLDLISRSEPDVLRQLRARIQPEGRRELELSPGCLSLNGFNHVGDLATDLFTIKTLDGDGTGKFAQDPHFGNRKVIGDLREKQAQVDDPARRHVEQFRDHQT
ncbi:hypothetical protein ACVWZZ_006591 [Bradyrhizobium sp. LM6.10]